MKGIIFKQKCGALFLCLARRKQYIPVFAVMILVGAAVFLYFYNSKDKDGALQGTSLKGSRALAEEAVGDDNKITKLKKETVSENVAVLDKNVDALEDHYRRAVVNVWISYQASPDNFFHIKDVVQILYQVNVPFLYQNFHTRLINALQMKEHALLSGDLVNLQKAEREITFLENTSFL